MKKIFQYIFIFFIYCLVCTNISAQESKNIKKGNNYFEKEEYYQALSYYEEAINDGEELSVEVKKKVGLCYYELDKIDQAYGIYSELEDNLSGADFLTYGKILHKFELYDVETKGAIFYYQKALSAGANPIEVNDLIESCKWAENNQKVEPYRVNPSTDLVFGQSFGIQYFKNGVVYSAAIEGSKNIDRNGLPFQNLVYADIQNNKVQDERVFSEKLVSPYHIGATSFTSDFNIMYFTKVLKKKGGGSRLSLFSATYNGKDWDDETELRFINEEFDYGHPAVSPDDKFLYFISDIKGGEGGTDIYRVERLRGGAYGRVKNLGSEVNTYTDEQFPFISKENILYFSSEGHLGFGGMDLYKAEYIDGKWKNVQNMKKPFNSSYDDFAYVINPKNPKVGFLSSNRSNNTDVVFTVEYVGEEEEKVEVKKEPEVGDVIDLTALPKVEEVEEVEEVKKVEEIVEEVKPDLSMFPSSFTAKVKSSYNNEAAKGVKVDIIDDITGKIIASGISNADGSFNVTIPDEYRKDGQEFELVFSKEGEFASKRMIVNIMEVEDINVNGLSLTPIFNDNDLDDISGMILYYEGDELTEESKETLNRLAGYLQRNPQLVVKLNSHTDARGSRIDNLNASQNMGNKVERLLMEKGVDGDATIPRGYGERYLVNKCKRGVLCDESDHLKNRRIEVVVWKKKN